MILLNRLETAIANKDFDTGYSVYQEIQVKHYLFFFFCSEAFQGLRLVRPFVADSSYP